MRDRPDQPPVDAAQRLRLRAKRAALVGAVAALICHALPPEHREVCRAIVNVCTGGLL